MPPPVLLAADVLTTDTLVPAGAVLSILLMVVGGSRAYEALRGTQNTQRQDLDAVEAKVERVAEDLKSAKERSDKRHEDLVHRVSITESREAVHDQKFANLEGHLRAQDAKLEKMDGKLDKLDNKLDRAPSRDDYPRRRGGHDDAA